ncbi:hypothetical protein DPMN_000613 [Dreissena polymorpha]|uniref:branched-chain-amino-acid transaminase n=1 Tax=Dreissena polymorpha TaxID=45954 RepID=A0A9D4RRY6_DREPO|nr:hypothetical protein DPMN_000613 [Dreissena polymorpha]
MTLNKLSVACCAVQQTARYVAARSYATASTSSFKAKDVEITRTKSPAAKPDVSKLKFGHHFSDHMLEVDWSESKGWEKPRICPMKNFQIHPAAKCLHYAVELFEGMKAFRGVDNRIRLFRPMENMKRMLTSAERSALPTFEGRELVELIKKLISIDVDWVPKASKEQPSSLYVRPTYIATEPTLGVAISTTAKLFVIIGPVGPYYATGLAPVKLLADPQYVRSWPGGSGGFKMGCNYAPTLYTQTKAASHGCQQVLWLFGDDHQLTEVGAMNLFTFWVNEHGGQELQLTMAEYFF